MTNDKPKKMPCLSDSAPHGVERQRRAASPQLLGGRAVDEVLDLPEQHLHEHGLRAQPSAPDASDGGRRQRERDEQRQRDQHDQVEVLRPEHEAEHDEPSFQEVEEHELLAVDRDERRAEEKRQQEPAEDRPSPVVTARRLAREDPLAPAIRVDAGELVPEALVFLVDRNGDVRGRAPRAVLRQSSLAFLVARRVWRFRSGRARPALRHDVAHDLQHLVVRQGLIGAERHHALGRETRS